MQHRQLIFNQQHFLANRFKEPVSSRTQSFQEVTSQNNIDDSIVRRQFNHVVNYAINESLVKTRYLSLSLSLFDW